MTTATTLAKAAPCALANPKAFFDRVRPLFGGKMTAEQVAGIQCKLDAFGAIGASIAFVAYGLATSFHETAQKMQPVREIGRGKGKAYGRPGRNGGQVPFGRGDVQLTWDDNYERADRELGLKGSLVANYDRALETGLSARIMVDGMTKGWFTGVSLARYLPLTRLAQLAQFVQARRVINVLDRADDIAAYAATFQTGLKDGGWGPVPPAPRA